MTLIEATKKAVTDHICNCDYSVECDSHPVHVNAFAEAIWRAAVSSKAAEAPGGQHEIVPPIELQFNCAKTIARDQGFDPMYGDFAKCVGAVMRAWRPGRFWDAAPAAPSERADELERELQVAHNVLRQHGVQCSLTNPMCDVCAKIEAAMTRAGLSSQEGK